MYLADDHSLGADANDFAYSTEPFGHLHFQSILLRTPVLDSGFEGVSGVDGGDSIRETVGKSIVDNGDGC